MPKDRENKISCAQFNDEMEIALQVLSGKWKASILWNLHNLEVIRFNQMLKILSGVTQKMLTQQLKVLEEQKLVVRRVIPNVPPIVEYSLTPLSQKVIPILKELNEWGKLFLENYDKNM